MSLCVAHQRQGSEAVGAWERARVAHTQRTTDNNALGQVDAIPSQRHQARASSQPRAPIGTQRAPNHSEWVIRIISDKVRWDSRPAASQANAAFRAGVLLWREDFQQGRWLRVSEPGTSPCGKGGKRPGRSEASASRATPMTLSALLSRHPDPPLVSMERIGQCERSLI